MMSAAIAHENYINTTAAKTAFIMDTIVERTNTMLNKIEATINNYSQDGRSDFMLRFPICRDIVKCEDLNNTRFWQMEWNGQSGAYLITVYERIKEDYTELKMPVDDQRDLMLNVLRAAGYQITAINGNWKVSWA